MTHNSLQLGEVTDFAVVNFQFSTKVEKKLNLKLALSPSHRQTVVSGSFFSLGFFQL